MKTAYQILGIPEGSTKEIAKIAYRRLIHIHHPDKPTGNTEKFIEVRKAWEQIEKGVVATYTKPNQTYTHWGFPQNNRYKEYMKQYTAQKTYQQSMQDMMNRINDIIDEAQKQRDANYRPDHYGN